MVTAGRDEIMKANNLFSDHMTKSVPKSPAARGQPRKMEGGRRVNVYLGEESIAIAKEIGAEAGMSEGIRIALAHTAKSLRRKT